MVQNLVEKIVQRFSVGLAGGHVVRAGDYVTVRPRHVMTHDNTAAVMEKFEGLGTPSFDDPAQPVFTLDHNIQDTGEANLAKYAAIEGFAKKHGVVFHGAGRGIGHQVMVEEGYAWPGTLVVASDSHSNMYGGLGALGTPVVRTDAAALWATGETWWQVPPVARVTLTGSLGSGVSGKDVIVALCGLYGDGEVLNHAVEFTGPGVAGLGVDDRLTIANMTTEWGALAGVFPCDEVTLGWLRGRIGTGVRITAEAVADLETSILEPDSDAHYAVLLEMDLGSVEPTVCGPDSVKVARPVSEVGDIAVQKAYLLSCTNARSGDLAAAAAALGGKGVADGVEFYVAAASDRIQAEAEESGDWQALLDAGARPLPPGCGPCIGLGVGLLEDGEVGISATNRNFKGRMGSRDAQAYLASPAVVAASAVAGRICAPEGPGGGAGGALEPHISRPAAAPREASAVEILDGFPATIEGELVLLDADNLNTDGIYPGTFTYREDVSPQEMAEVAFQNYDPDFGSVARTGDILVGGFSFGCGSSREQAATCLAHFGIPLVVAGSFSATYKRNAFNNGFPLLDCPDLVAALREAAGGDGRPTVRTGLGAVVDFAAGEIRVGEAAHPFAPLGPTAQRLVIAGGLEALVRSGQ